MTPFIPSTVPVPLLSPQARAEELDRLLFELRLSDWLDRWDRRFPLSKGCKSNDHQRP